MGTKPSYLKTSCAMALSLLAASSAFATDSKLDTSSLACKAFEDFAIKRVVDKKYPSSSRSDLAPFNTDSIMVLKNGKVVYEWYDGVNSTVNTSNILWSASKDITGLLIARTIQDGYTFNGHPVTLDSKLEEFFPFDELVMKHPEMQKKDFNRTREFYNKVTIDNLIQMSAGFVWKEYYDQDLTQSTFMPMLYTTGHNDMVDFSLQAPMSQEGPGKIWNYSGGNANILMAILQKIHGDHYKTMPWDLLFKPLGITQARIERDGSGRFIGSSYIYMSTRDMAKIGQLLLQDGKWEGKQLLPPSWTKEAQEINESVLQPATSLDVIKALGTEGKRVFWLNKNIYRPDGEITEPRTGRKILYPQEMPESPKDMYFAAGHYGQLIIVIPSHDMVIVRTGADVKYWDHIQPLTVKALQCFNSYQPPFVADLTPPSAGVKQSAIKKFFKEDLPAVPAFIESIKFLKTSGIVNGYMAKEMCSYLYTSDVAARMPQEQWQKSFYQRLGLPKIFLGVLDHDLEFKFDKKEKSVTVSRYYRQGVTHGHGGDLLLPKVYTSRFKAQYVNNNQDGCILTEKESDL